MTECRFDEWSTEHPFRVECREHGKSPALCSAGKAEWEQNVLAYRNRIAAKVQKLEIVAKLSASLLHLMASVHPDHIQFSDACLVCTRSRTIKHKLIDALVEAEEEKK